MTYDQCSHRNVVAVLGNPSNPRWACRSCGKPFEPTTPLVCAPTPGVERLPESEVGDTRYEILESQLAQLRHEIYGWQEWSNGLADLLPEPPDNDRAQESTIYFSLADLIEGNTRIAWLLSEIRIFLLAEKSEWWPTVQGRAEAGRLVDFIDYEVPCDDGSEQERRSPYVPTGKDGFLFAWATFLEWADRVIGGDANDQVTKFREESSEFLDDPSLDEAIDCMAVLMCWADRSGYPPQAVLVRLWERIEVWEKRTYVPSGDGTYHHVESADA